jgi:hypothetical protein
MVGIFERSDFQDEAYQLLSAIDPSNLSTYERLLE